MSALAKTVTAAVPIPEPENLHAQFSLPAFVAILKNLAKIIPKRTRIPFLKCVKITAHHTNPKLAIINTTDMEHGVHITLDADISSDFACLVDINKLIMLIENFKQEECISFETQSGSVTVHLGSFTVDIPARTSSEDLEEFDKLQEHYQTFLLSPSPPTSHLSGAVITNIFTKLIDFVARDKYRPYLNGIYMHMDDRGQLAFVATDGRILARYRLSVAGEIRDIINPRGILIPHNTIKTFLLHCRYYRGDITITVAEKAVSFTTDSVTIESELIDTTYPDYRRLIDDDYTHNLEARVYTKALIEAINQVTAMAQDKKAIVTLAFAPNQFTLSHSAEDGTKMERQGYTETNITLTIHFHKYGLLAILRHIPVATIIRFKSDQDVIQIYDADEPNITYLILSAKI